MTITLALWQIAGLILLTLLLGGILRRWVILIVMARSLRWSKLQRSLTDLTGQNLSSQNSSESGSGTYNLGHSRIQIVNDENTFGPSGFSPGGVSYTQVPIHGGALIPKGRKGFGRKK